MGFASPLTDFSKGKTALDVNWKPNLKLDNAEFKKDTNYEAGIMTGLGNKLALQYRQTRYDCDNELTRYRVKNQELNLIYQLSKNVDIFAGYSKTKTTDSYRGFSVPDKNSPQLGVIGNVKLDKKSTLYAILSGGDNVANVEFGYSYALTKNLEMNTTYRHLTVEKIGCDEHKKSNMRGFGVGMTYNF
jgi:predicted porin